MILENAGLGPRRGGETKLTVVAVKFVLRDTDQGYLAPPNADTTRQTSENNHGRPVGTGATAAATATTMTPTTPDALAAVEAAATSFGRP